ncbi:restriction endonuclease subunit S [Bradyrhizobium sp. USDA 329]|uniref:restriction endonuclease subunit S n=1 Tax=unclassified Bradyrhizobium TaxID=2631580 RepID=UPI0035166804
MSALREFIASQTPPGWTTKPLWSLFRRRKLTGYEDEELLSVYRDYGVIPKSSRDDNHNKESDDLSGYQLVTEGALVTNKMKAWQGSIAISRYRGIVSPAYYVYEPLSSECDQFLHYLLRSEPYIALYGRISKGVRVSQWDLEHEALRNVPVMLPDFTIQKAIADFLDQETVRIDQLIERKQRLIALLNERSMAAIEEAISASARPSKLGHHVKIIPGYAFQSANFSTDDNDIRLLRGANVSPGAIRWDDTVYWPHDLAHGLESFRLAEGDIVMGMDRPWVSGGIRVAELTSSDVPSLLLQRVCKIVPLRTMAKDFLKLMLSSKRFLGYFEPELTGVSVPHISGDQIARFSFPYIAVEEQIERARSCSAVLTANERISSMAQRSIERLRELRGALITAAVTGQIDISSWGKRGHPDRRLDEIQEAMHV